MSYVTMLLVEHDPVVAWGIIRALERHRIPRPQLAESGRDAIEWVTRHPFGLCVVDYQLPDMNGVDVTVQLRQRKPDLPIFMLSGAKSEAVAVAAFRAGVSDYVPKDKQLIEAVVGIIQRFAELEAKMASIPATHAIPDGMPRELLNPNYQNRLRVIGRQIDLNRYRMASVFEVDGGFLVKGIPDHGRQAEALEFPDRDFLHFITEAYRNRGSGERGASTSPLLPSGYEDFLRAIGAALDQHEAESITIAEFASVIVVGGNTKADTPEQISLGGLQWILQRDEILQVLDEGYRRREARNRPSDSVLDRIFGRPGQPHFASA